MTSGRAALSWGFGLSLALHAAWLGNAPEPRPYLKRAPPAQHVELTLIQVPKAEAKVASAPAQEAPKPTPEESKPLARGPVRRVTRVVAPEPSPVAPSLPAAEGPGRDLGALERTLKRIAATTELTPDQRRKAMLVVLRTWEDPSRNESAHQLIDVLLRELHPGQDR